MKFYVRKRLKSKLAAGWLWTILMSALLLVGCGSSKIQAESEEAEEKTPIEAAEMQVHFIDVEQGDATLITCDGEAMLIDTGDNTKGTKIQAYMSKQGIRKLKYLILTHPDADHIGAADVIITKFDIDQVFMSDYTKDNQSYREVIQALDDRNYKWSVPKVGNTYTLGSAFFTIIAPNKEYSDPNNSSIGLIVENGKSRFLFTGDAQEEAEKDILANGISIECDVYKAGHHGSNTSNTKEFLEAANPDFVVISCAEGNSYGHPHAEPMNHFRSMGMKVFRTDEQGVIVAVSDGTHITWNCVPSESWSAGERTEASKELMQDEYVIGNKNTKVFHKPICSHLPKEKNQIIFYNREEALEAGYDNPCDYCHP